MLANGERVRASADEHPDLYWAIRGGGGNFGVVTSFLFRLHEVGTVVGGPTFWPVETGAEVLSAYREFLPSAPRELNGFFAFTHRAAGAAVPGGAPHAQGVRRRVVLRRRGRGGGGQRDGAAARRRARAADARRGSRCRTRCCRARSTGSTRPATSGTGARTSSRRSPTRPSSIHARFGAEMPTLQVDDAPVPDRRRRARRRPRPTRPGATATRNWGSVFAGVDPDPANVDAIRRWSIDYHEALHPYSAGGAYVNMMMDEGQERVRASYRDNYDRLARIKADVRPGEPLPRQPEHPAEGVAPAVAGLGRAAARRPPRRPPARPRLRSSVDLAGREPRARGRAGTACRRRPGAAGTPPSAPPGARAPARPRRPPRARRPAPAGPRGPRSRRSRRSRRPPRPRPRPGRRSTRDRRAPRRVQNAIRRPSSRSSAAGSSATTASQKRRSNVISPA